MTGTIHNFVYKPVVKTFVCEDCGMTPDEILNEEIEATLEHRQPIFVTSHN